MAKQMSLFSSEVDSDSRRLAQTVGGTALDEMFAVGERFRNPAEFLKLLLFVARFPNYSILNGILLYLQDPSISFVATAGGWIRRYNRRPKPDARPLVILAPMSPVRFVYDFSDTEGDVVRPDELRSAEEKYKLTQRTFDNTVHNCRVSGIVVREIQFVRQRAEGPIPVTREAIQQYGNLHLDAQMNYLILLNQTDATEDKYADLAYELGRIFCGHVGACPNAWWQDRRSEPSSVRKIESDSVAFLVSRRKQLKLVSERHSSRFTGQDKGLPVFKLSAVVNATSYIEDMGKSLWRRPKKQGRNVSS